jgi:hypothetical protein
MAVRGVDDEPDEGTGVAGDWERHQHQMDWMAADLGLAVHGSCFSESRMREL